MNRTIFGLIIFFGSSQSYGMYDLLVIPNKGYRPTMNPLALVHEQARSRMVQPYVCDFCRASYQSREYLQMHMKRDHTQPQQEEHVGWFIDHDFEQWQLESDKHRMIAPAIVSTTTIETVIVPDDIQTSVLSQAPSVQKDADAAAIQLVDAICTTPFTHDSAQEQQSAQPKKKKRIQVITQQKLRHNRKKKRTNTSISTVVVPASRSNRYLIVKQKGMPDCYRCPICDKDYNCKSSASEHFFNDHIVCNVLNCHDCQMTFTRRSSLYKHMRVHHGRTKKELTPTEDTIGRQTASRDHEKKQKDEDHSKAWNISSALNNQGMVTISVKKSKRLQDIGKPMPKKSKIHV
jgi:hypothetical protein